MTILYKVLQLGNRSRRGSVSVFARRLISCVFAVSAKSGNAVAGMSWPLPVQVQRRMFIRSVRSVLSEERIWSVFVVADRRGKKMGGYTGGGKGGIIPGDDAHTWAERALI